MKNQNITILQKNCEKRFERFYELTKNKIVILHSRWTFKMYPIPNYIDNLTFTNSKGGKEFEYYRTFNFYSSNKSSTDELTDKRFALNEYIEKLSLNANKVLFIGPVPEVGWDVNKINTKNYLFKKRTIKNIFFPYKDFIYRNRFILEEMKKFKRFSNLLIIRPDKLFCNTFIKNNCVAQYNYLPFYVDEDHLSTHGSDIVVEEVLKTLDKINIPKS